MRRCFLVSLLFFFVLAFGQEEEEDVRVNGEEPPLPAPSDIAAEGGEGREQDVERERSREEEEPPLPDPRDGTRCGQDDCTARTERLKQEIVGVVTERLQDRLGPEKAEAVARQVAEGVAASRLIVNGAVDSKLISELTGDIVDAEAGQSRQHRSGDEEVRRKMQRKLTKKLAKRVGPRVASRIASRVGARVATRIASHVGTRIATQIASRIAMAAAGPIAGAALGGLTFALGMIGDAVQKHKCMLRCCPKKGLSGSFACKYQPRHTCVGYYSDYPGSGDHACFWNEEKGVCEVGLICRDKTFNFFALVGSVCPPCPYDGKGYQGKQWTVEELKKQKLPSKFYVDPKTEYVWCAPKVKTTGMISVLCNP